MSNSSFQYPRFNDMFDDRRLLKRSRNFLRFHTSKILNRSQVKGFEDFLNQHPLWQPLFTEFPFRCYMVLRKYVDSRFSADERLHAILTHLILAEKYFGKTLCERLIKEKSLLFYECNNIKFYLNINRIEAMEGLFSFSLKTADGEAIYDTSFTFLDDNCLLIGSVQGSNESSAPTIVKICTKSLFGVRPAFMMVHLLQLLSQEFGLTPLGIPHKAQCKYRFNDNTRLLFNYDKFWQENYAIKATNYWQLPLNPARKPLEEIESKKRSMYRKRYAMLDELQQSFVLFFKENL